MSNKSIIAGLLIALTSGQYCQANIFNSMLRKIVGLASEINTFNSKNISSFKLGELNVKWVDEGKSIEHNETRDLSDYKGPFVIRNAVGRVEVREGVSPRLEIQKRLAAESMDDIDTTIFQDKSSSGLLKTVISVDIKADEINGEAVNYTLYVPKSEKVSWLSVIFGSIIVKFCGALGYAQTSNGSIKVDGITNFNTVLRFDGNLVVKASIGDIDIRNVNGCVQAATTSGDIDISKVDGWVRAATTIGDIDIRNVNGRVQAATTNGNIDISKVDGWVQAATTIGDIRAQEIDGACSAQISNGTIEVNKVLGQFSGKTRNGKIYRDGKRID